MQKWGIHIQSYPNKALSITAIFGEYSNCIFCDHNLNRKFEIGVHILHEIIFTQNQSFHIGIREPGQFLWT